ncbi:RNA-binding protein S1 [Aerococcus christensenii]|uniref:RNA-binding protein S1 n=1 Tax=Aerococcus christensenii TaxID=87541 RepID=A0A133Y0N3_9LACT|nr:S1 domain-containing RNA-binding protein [Aerococcus christensenii]KXB36760.1 S1 RNA binding domain protein [Aerococcus christensenii]MDK8233877.1 S1 domain-containing RNA-binding protein [Aerococcus christensenii]PKY90887.1 RNA-binding protein S1 [Aerococcus christensenii]WEB71187.1 S1 domain-containing RNA-binding protein [Aerococcus christensenii]
MTIKVGDKVTGKVTGIVKFGAFVDLGEGENGLVHISEISDNYVKDIHDFVAEGDEVTAIVTKVQEDGKVALSIKKAKEDNLKKETISGKENFRHPRQTSKFSSKKPSKTSDFDTMMNDFLKASDDRLNDLKRNTEGKRGGRGGRRS